MAIIKHSDIIQQGDPLKPLHDSLDLLNDQIVKLTSNTKKLETELRGVQQTSDGKEAKELVETTQKLNTETEKLNKTKKTAVTVNDQIIKAQKAIADAESAEAIELEKLKLQKQDQIKLNKDIAKELRDLEKGYQKENRSINSLRESNKKLTKERNALNLETKEGQKRLIEINQKLDENNEAIKGNVDGLTQQKIGIGGYKEAIDQAIPGLSGMAAGFKTMTIQALKFIATPIGAVLTAIVLALKLLQASFNRSLKSQEKLNVITGKLSAAFGFLLDMLEPVVEFIIDSVLDSFDKMGKAVVFVIEMLEKWGIISEGTAKKLDKTSDAADRLATAERDLIESDIALQKLQLRYQTLAERQRQIRDDESKSIEERIAANKELGRLLRVQTQEELKVAKKVLFIAKEKADRDNYQLENIQEIGEAEIKLLEITERVEAQRSEQLVNTNSLLREQQEQIFANMQAELDRFNQSVDQSTRQMEIDDAYTDQIMENAEEFDAAEQMKQDALQRTQDEAEKANLKFLEQAAVVRDVSIQAGMQIGNLMAQGLLTFKSFGKILLTSTLDLIQKQVNIYGAAILAREIAGKSFAGIATSAILIGIINGALQTAKAGIANFNEGTESVPGSGNTDTVPAMLTPGERVVPAEINKHLMGIPNKDLPKLMTSDQRNGLIISLLMSGNETSKQMLESMINSKDTWDNGKYRYIQHGNGTIEKFLIDG